MLCPIRTMPWEDGSSVDVVSTDLAHRRQRRTSTEATGRVMESMLYRPDLVDRSESEEAEEEELE
jgi:hypothetical protein